MLAILHPNAHLPKRQLGVRREFVERYRARGGAVTFEVYPGMPHSFVNRDPEHEQSRRALADIRAFIERQSAPPRMPT